MCQQEDLWNLTTIIRLCVLNVRLFYLQKKDLKSIPYIVDRKDEVGKIVEEQIDNVVDQQKLHPL